MKDNGTEPDVSHLLKAEEFTPLADFLEQGGEKDHRGLIVFEINGEAHVPSFLLDPENPGMLKEPHSTINAVTLSNKTAAEKLVWWNDSDERVSPDPRKNLHRRLLLWIHASMSRP